ncbi:hypothetical protein PRIPAC_70117 [Pristionchus pacificus]|uniref:G protein-coupled receptor n=1 Tax=Pristionchus pacificus TaxID=54126 RepID=A0A2A6CZY6_PRIPA|nr:hypothetical protein PRIPAC_70117 [Pristionchus pacificus]|eukprot:PDM83656.1 G protein-coupled receptor [Pristionchus pacificus]
MENSTGRLLYNLHWDRDYALDLIDTCQTILPFLTLTTIRPAIFYVLFKSHSFSPDIRWGYVVNMIALSLHEFNFCFLYRLQLVVPYAAFYCEGPICRIGLPMNVLMVYMAFSMVASIPTFLYILLRMHHKIVLNTNTTFIFSKRTQFVLVFAESLILFINVIACAVFTEESANAEKMKKSPELAWLVARGGRIMLFGPPGNPELFGRELFLLACSVILIAPLIVFLTRHSTRTMKRTKVALTSRTQQTQNRLQLVFFLQMHIVMLFYALPMAVMISTMFIDLSAFPPVSLALLRYTILPLFSIESALITLVFLLKNPTNLKLVADTLRSLSCGIIGDRQSSTTTGNFSDVTIVQVFNRHTIKQRKPYSRRLQK